MDWHGHFVFRTLCIKHTEREPQLFYDRFKFTQIANYKT